MTQGYQVSVDEAVNLQWEGAPIPFDADIPLREGWSIVAYFPNYLLSAAAPEMYVVSNILDHLLLAKDVAGRFILTGDFLFSNMRPWSPGQGYMVRMDAPDLILNYPPHREEEIAILRSPVAGGYDNDLRTGENMSLLVTSFENLNVSEGRVVAMNAGGIVVGSGEVQGGRCGIAVWGDDSYTEKVDGLHVGEAFELFLGNPTDDILIRLSPAAFQLGENLAYEKDGITALSVTAESVIPDDYYLAEGYPNPFNSTVRLSFGLPEESRVSISIFDLSGRQVDVLESGVVKAGQHVATWNAATKPSGIYWVQMNAGDFKQVRKIVLMK